MHLSLSARATPCRTVSGAPIAAKAMKPPATVVPHLRRWQIAIDALWLEWTEMPIATLTAAGIPTYGVPGLWGDADGNGVHGLDERVEVRSVMTGRQFLNDLIRAYAF